MNLKVQTKINIYELNGHKKEDLQLPQLIIDSHWNDTDRVVLRFPDGEDEIKLTVVAKDLIKAIQNAQNSSRF